MKPFATWLQEFAATPRAQRMWEAQCALPKEPFPEPASRASLDVAGVVSRVPNSVFAVASMGVPTPMKRSATEPGSSAVKGHLGSLDAATAIRLPLRPAAP